MKTQLVDVSRQPDDALSAAITALRSGEALVFPTESVYGLGVIAGHADAEKRLRELKGREKDKPFQVLIAGIDDIEATGGRRDPLSAALAETFWPGPLTLVLDTKDDATTGYRWPDADFACRLIRALGRPLIATSANPAGAPPATTAAAAREYFDGQVACILDGGPSPVGVASTVLRIEQGKPKILREGAISRTEIERICATLYR